MWLCRVISLYSVTPTGYGAGNLPTININLWCYPLLYLDWMVVKVRYVRSAPVTSTLAQVREKSSIFPHTHVTFAPVTDALDTLLAYVAVQGYLALLRYTDWVWQCGKKSKNFSLNLCRTYPLFRYDIVGKFRYCTLIEWLLKLGTYDPPR